MRVWSMFETDKQFDARLIDEYERLNDIKKVAEKENAVETVKLINEKMELIKLKLKPTKLPDQVIFPSVLLTKGTHILYFITTINCTPIRAKSQVEFPRIARLKIVTIYYIMLYFCMYSVT